MNRLKTKLVVHKQTELLQATLIPIINSNSITEAISRVAAMRKLSQQTIKCCNNKKEDKKAISENKLQTIMQSTQLLPTNKHLMMTLEALTTKQAELKAAELNLAAEKATAEIEKLLC